MHTSNDGEMPARAAELASTASAAPSMRRRVHTGAQFVNAAVGRERGSRGTTLALSAG
jgi:hypothetical protein